MKEKLKVVEYYQKSFRIQRMLGLDPNKYSFEEQDIISALQVAFEEDIMHSLLCLKQKTWSLLSWRSS